MDINNYLKNNAVNLLIVEDDEEQAKALCYYIENLEDMQVNSYHAFDVIEALDALHEKQIDCILLDYNLGTSTGIDLIHTVRSNDDDTAIILTSGTASDEVVRKALIAGADDYLSKTGFSADKLKKYIINSLEKVVLKRELRKKNGEIVRLSEGKSNSCEEISDKLKSKLNSIKECCERVKTSNVNEADTRDAINTICKNTEELLSSFNKLLK